MILPCRRGRAETEPHRAALVVQFCATGKMLSVSIFYSVFPGRRCTDWGSFCSGTFYCHQWDVHPQTGLLLASVAEWPCTGCCHSGLLLLPKDLGSFLHFCCSVPVVSVRHSAGLPGWFRDLVQLPAVAGHAFVAQLSTVRKSIAFIPPWFNLPLVLLVISHLVLANISYFHRL